MFLRHGFADPSCFVCLTSWLHPVEMIQPLNIQKESGLKWSLRCSQFRFGLFDQKQTTKCLFLHLILTFSKRGNCLVTYQPVLKLWKHIGLLIIINKVYRDTCLSVLLIKTHTKTAAFFCKKRGSVEQMFCRNINRIESRSFLFFSSCSSVKPLHLLQT